MLLFLLLPLLNQKILKIQYENFKENYVFYKNFFRLLEIENRKIKTVHVMKSEPAATDT